MFYVFDSSLGYNCIIRLGKIHNLYTETLKYVLDVNRDLKVLNHNFRVFSRHVKNFLFVKKIRKYFTPHHLFEIQLGKKTIRQTIEEIKNKKLH
tara:strand:- start:76 stop:357 length:282 start_codon:yes stop_codon:yes gene_type:complete